MSHPVLKKKRKKVIEPLTDEDEVEYGVQNYRDEIREASKIEDNSRESDTSSEDNDIVENNKKYENEVKYLLDMKTNTDKLSSENARDLRRLVIQLRHQVPPQHQIERACGSRVPSACEKEKFKTLIAMKSGVFSHEEDQRIKHNWHSFCKTHNWDVSKPEPFLYLKHNNKFYLSEMKERKKFVQFLANGLFDRSLYSVYHRFRNLMNPHLCAKYSREEDERIIDYIEHSRHIDHSRQFSDLAKVLNRTRASVWRRYRLLKKKRKQKQQDLP